MKRTIAIVAGVAAVGVGALYLGSTLSAQAPAAAQAPAQTRVGVVNTIQILKSYHKFKTFQDQLKTIADPFEKRDKDLKTNLKQWQDFVAQPNAPATEKDKAENEMKNRKREIEDNALAGRKAIAKRSDEQLVQLYREIEDAVKRYAGANGFHIVLQYEDSPADLHSPGNIQRKMQGIASTGCTGLMYAAPGLDLTLAVVNTLNQSAPGGPPAGN